VVTRPGSRDHARQTTADRPAASYATGLPNLDAPMRHCACGAAYRDHADGHAAHHTVFGHRPVRKPAPDTGNDKTPAGDAPAATERTTQ